MGIVAQEVPAETPPELIALAQEMRDLLHADLEETEIARRIRDFFVGNQELELEVWPLMSAPDRRAWKLYWKQGDDLRRQS